MSVIPEWRAGKTKTRMMPVSGFPVYMFYPDSCLRAGRGGNSAAASTGLLSNKQHWSSPDLKLSLFR
jgi:hypothetical protein